MRASRFPPFFSPPSIAAMALSVLTVAAGLFLLGNASPFWLMLRDRASMAGVGVLAVLCLIVLVGVYLAAAPGMWAFTRRYTPAAHGQKHLPPHLLAACLADIDYPCPGCTYNLRGLQGTACPECSAPVIIYLYGTQRVSTRWTALIVCWLTLSLVASAVAITAFWDQFMTILTGRPYWWGISHTLQLGAVGVVSAAGLFIGIWRAIALVIPKPPHKQSVCARRTAVWLVALNAGCVLGVAVVLGSEVLDRWY